MPALEYNIIFEHLKNYVRNIIEQNLYTPHQEFSKFLHENGPMVLNLKIKINDSQKSSWTRLGVAYLVKIAQVSSCKFETIV